MENNKILLEIYIPSIEKEYDVFVPISKRIGTIKRLIQEGINDLNGNDISIGDNMNFYSKDTGLIYDVNKKIIETDLVNGSRIVLI